MTKEPLYMKLDGTFVYKEEGKTISVKSETSLDGTIREIGRISHPNGRVEIVEDTQRLGGQISRKVFENDSLSYTSRVVKNSEGKEEERDVTLYFGLTHIRLKPF